jgi:carbon storage regulator
MLVLLRKSNESVLIGKDIIVTVLAVDGDRVKLGVKAPPEISILRQELCDQVVDQNSASVATSRNVHNILSDIKSKLTSKH